MRSATWLKIMVVVLTLWAAMAVLLMSSFLRTTEQLPIGHDETDHSGWQVPVTHSDSVLPIMELSIGTPPLTYYLLLDTGSYLIWTQCITCEVCFNQVSKKYNPNASKTNNPIKCGDDRCDKMLFPNKTLECCTYWEQYGTGQYTAGSIGTDRFVLGDRDATIVFGCSIKSSPTFRVADGIAGFGDHSSSLPSQLGVTNFSYCVPFPEEGKKGTVRLGSHAKVRNDSSNTIPLFILGGYNLPPLVGVTVGGIRLPVALKYKIFIDSGAPSSYLEESVYLQVKKQILSLMKLPRRGDLGEFICFEAPEGDADFDRLGLPELIYHFKTGAEWKFSVKNHFRPIPENGICLLISNGGERSIIGINLQYGTEVYYDLSAWKLSFFIGANC